MPSESDERPLIVLASGSETRAKLLRQAGLAVTVVPPGVDESEIKLALRAAGSAAADVAIDLAEAKAVSVSQRYSGALVIGADQMLDCDGTWFDKPVDRAAAADSLRRLRGRRHSLVSAVAVFLDGAHLWHKVDSVSMRMRSFSDDFLESYLDEAGDSVLGSVGAYQLEGLGAQLFDGVEGDYFTVLGLPLLPLLEFLRQRGALPR